MPDPTVNVVPRAADCQDQFVAPIFTPPPGAPYTADCGTFISGGQTYRRWCDPSCYYGPVYDGSGTFVYFLRNCSFSCPPTITACTCEEVTCPTGYYYDPDLDTCTKPCPAGFCWCDPLGDCIACPEPDCKEELNCSWDTGTCEWECDTPSCPPGVCWSWVNCACGCPAGYQCCEPTQECVLTADPPCSVGRGCVWDGTTCAWDCTTPTCPDGQYYDFSTCSCQPGWDGVDLAQAQVGFIFRSYRTDAGEVCVDRTRDEGDSWEGLPFASDAEGGQVPSLAVDRNEHLFCCYHDTSQNLRVWRSRDWGGTWTDFLTKTDRNYKHVRAAFGVSALFVACWSPDSTAIKVYRSEDYGATLTEVHSITDTPALPEQMPSLEVDRRGYLHAYFYNANGSPEHIQSKGLDPQSSSDWGAEESFLLLAQDYGAVGPPVGTVSVSVALGTMYGVVAHQEDAAAGGDTFVFLTDETYHLGIPAGYQRFLPLPAGLAFKHPQYLGTLVDRRENVWVIGKMATVGFGGALGPRVGGALGEV